MAKKKYDKVATESGEYSTTLSRTFLARKKWEPANPGHVLSFMPGTVEEITVKKGQKVEQGDRLMIFKAMKMNNNILSPISGKVKAINVKAGENLPKNALMIEIE